VRCQHGAPRASAEFYAHSRRWIGGGSAINSHASVMRGLHTSRRGCVMNGIWHVINRLQSVGGVAAVLAVGITATICLRFLIHGNEQVSPSVQAAASARSLLHSASATWCARATRKPAPNAPRR
jgi:hypothetical protein